MCLVHSFNSIATQTTINISDLTPHIQYKILKANKLKTKYGDSVTLCLEIYYKTIAWVLVPKRYISIFTETEINNINTGHTKVCLEYKDVRQKHSC